MRRISVYSIRAETESQSITSARNTKLQPNFSPLCTCPQITAEAQVLIWVTNKFYQVCKFTNAAFEQISKYVKDEGLGFYWRKELTYEKAKGQNKPCATGLDLE